jgi:hypothetical protein
MPVESLSVNIESLAFLLRLDSELLQEIAMANDAYHSDIEAINYRSLTHREKVQPALARADVRPGAMLSLEDVQRILTVPLFLAIENATNRMIENVDNDIARLEAVANKLAIRLKELFPDGKLLRMEPRQSDTRPPSERS